MPSFNGSPLKRLSVVKPMPGFTSTSAISRGLTTRRSCAERLEARSRTRGSARTGGLWRAGDRDGFSLLHDDPQRRSQKPSRPKSRANWAAPRNDNFPILTDEHVSSALVKALRNAGWLVHRVEDEPGLGKGSLDDKVFAYAAERGWVWLSRDQRALRHPKEWRSSTSPSAAC